MRDLMITIVAGALLGQAPAAAAFPRQQESPPKEAELVAALEEIDGLTNDMFALMGTCEAQLPHSLIESVTWPFSAEALADATEDQRARVAPMAAAFAAGQASPRANTLTPEECSAEMEAVSAKMKAISERVAS